MRVLFVISTLQFGGAERVLSILASRFAEDHEVCVLRFDDKKPFYDLNPKIKLESLNLGVSDYGMIGNLKKRFGKIFAIRKAIKKGNFDLVISFMDSTNLLVLLAHLGLKTKLVISEHSHHSFLGLKWKVLKRIFYPFADALSVLSKDDFEYYEYVKNRAVIYNPVNDELIKKAKFTDCKKENLIIFVGRLVDIKGCDVFLKALKFADLEDFEIAVLGDGQNRIKYENLAKELGLKVNFKGSVKDISEYYAKAKIIVLSSLNEGLGNVLIESIFFRVLRVATPTNGAKELIKNGVDGLICDDFDPRNLGELIKKASLVDHRELTQNALRQAEQFGVDEIYKKWLNLANIEVRK